MNNERPSGKLTKKDFDQYIQYKETLDQSITTAFEKADRHLYDQFNDDGDSFKTNTAEAILQKAFSEGQRDEYNALKGYHKQYATYNRTPSIHESPAPIDYKTLFYGNEQNQKVDLTKHIYINEDLYPLNHEQKEYLDRIITLLNDETTVVEFTSPYAEFESTGDTSNYTNHLKDIANYNVLAKENSEETKPTIFVPTLDKTKMSKKLYDVLGIIRYATEGEKDKFNEQAKNESKTILDAKAEYSQCIAQVPDEAIRQFMNKEVKANIIKLQALRTKFAHALSKNVTAKAKNYETKREILVIAADELVAKENGLDPHQTVTRKLTTAFKGLFY